VDSGHWGFWHGGAKRFVTLLQLDFVDC
jgi:hypothetical protein